MASRGQSFGLQGQAWRTHDGQHGFPSCTFRCARSRRGASQALLQAPCTAACRWPLPAFWIRSILAPQHLRHRLGEARQGTLVQRSVIQTARQRDLWLHAMQACSQRGRVGGHPRLLGLKLDSVQVAHCMLCAAGCRVDSATHHELTVVKHLSFVIRVGESSICSHHLAMPVTDGAYAQSAWRGHQCLHIHFCTHHTISHISMWCQDLAQSSFTSPLPGSALHAAAGPCELDPLDSAAGSCNVKSMSAKPHTSVLPCM
jgi:hypothetical protein